MTGPTATPKAVKKITMGPDECRVYNAKLKKAKVVGMRTAGALGGDWKVIQKAGESMTAAEIKAAAK